MGYITNLNELSLLISEQYMPDVKVAVDITLGNGLDVQKFLPYIQEKLIAIDIQQQAIDVSKERLQKVLSEEEYSKIQQDLQTLSQLVSAPISVGRGG